MSDRQFDYLDVQFVGLVVDQVTNQAQIDFVTANDRIRLTLSARNLELLRRRIEEART